MNVGWPTGMSPGEVLVSSIGNSYSLLSPLGQGGNATAFSALGKSRDYKGIPFAVKFFTGNESRRESFAREAKYLSENSHSAILPVLEFGQTAEGQPFYVARLMAETLKETITFGGLTDTDKLLVSSQICSAVAFLHRADPPMVHRDVKPANIFLIGRTCVLGDFGMIMRTGEEDVEPGTPARYRTPELVDHINGGAPPDQRSDLFQLGLVLYELFTGVNPLLPAAKSDPIELGELPVLPQALQPVLKNLLASAVSLQKHRRPSSEDLLDAFVSLIETDVRSNQDLKLSVIEEA